MPSTLDDYPVLVGTVRIPRVGPPTAELEIRADEPYTGAATLTLEDTTFSVTALRASLKSPSRVAVSVVGGAGGLETALLARQYVAATVGAVLADIMTASGESLSSTVASSLQGRQLTTWQRAAGTARQAIAALATALEVTWRVLLDGTIWLGAETWAEIEPEDVRILDDDQATGTVTTSLAPTLLPGLTYRDQRLENVTHVLEKDRGTTEASSTSPATALGAFMAPTEQRIKYSRLYSARVVKQNADGTLQVLPDADAIKGSGLDNVRIRLGVPGTCTVPKGAKVEVLFEDGDPQKPIAVGFHDGTLTELKLGSGADYVALAAKVLTELQSIKTWADAHTHPTGMGPSGVPTTPMTTPSSVAAAKTKAE